MLDVRNCSVKPYFFKDGGTVVFTKNPSQKFYLELVSLDMQDSASVLSVVDNALDKMLDKKDKHYIEELPYDVKLTLMQDYLKYHMEQLESRFPNTGRA